jgi:hypothetical protein
MSSIIESPERLAAAIDAEPLLQFFSYAHLPPALQEISRPFAELAVELVAGLPQNAERRVCVRKLLEAKDCAVRAKIYKKG